MDTETRDQGRKNVIQFDSAGMEHYHTSHFGRPLTDGQQNLPPPPPPPPETFVPARSGESDAVPFDLQSVSDAVADAEQDAQ